MDTICGKCKIESKKGKITRRDFNTTDEVMAYIAYILTTLNIAGKITDSIGLQDTEIDYQEKAQLYINTVMDKGSACYTVLNKQGKRICHQNWLYYDGQVLICFEPNGTDMMYDTSYWDLTIYKFLQLIQDKLHCKIISACPKPINFHDGCITASTVLLLLYMLDKDFPPDIQYTNFLLAAAKEISRVADVSILRYAHMTRSDDRLPIRFSNLI